METRRLVAFIRMVDLGSLTRASRDLCIAQPALSQQLHALEADFGVQLLTRSRKGVTPTAAGRTLYRHAQVILKQLTQAHIEVKEAYGELSGRVVVGLPQAATLIMLAPLLRAAAAQHPHVTLSLADGLPGYLLDEMISNGRLDVGLVPGGFSEAAIESEPILLERIGAFTCSNGEPAGPAAAMNVLDLVDKPLVLPRLNSRVRQVINDGFEEAGLRPNVVAEMDSINSMAAAAAAGVGWAIMPMSGVIVDSSLVSRELINPAMEYPLQLALSKNDDSPLAVKAINDLVREVAQDLVQSGKWPGGRLIEGS